MASNNQSPAFVVIALLLFAAANPLCHAQLNGGQLGSIFGLISGLLNGVTPIVPGIVNSVTPVVPGIVNSVTPVVPRIVNSITPVVPGIVNSITPVVPGIVNSITPVVPGVLNSLTPILPGLVNSLTPVVPGVLNSLTPILPGVVNSLTPAVPAVVNGLNGLNISGLLCCTANGNCSTGATPLPAGIPITINCTNLVGGTATVGQGAIVGANGGFNVSVTNLLSVLGGLLNPNSLIPCTVSVPLPLPLINQAVCPVLTTVTGALTGAVSTVQSVTSTALGLVGSVTVPSFSANATVRT